MYPLVDNFLSQKQSLYRVTNHMHAVCNGGVEWVISPPPLNFQSKFFITSINVNFQDFKLNIV